MKILKEDARTIFDAAESGNTEVLKRLLQAGEDVEQQTPTPRGYTPMMLTASQNEVACIDLLAAHGSNINAHSKGIGRTALDLACDKGCLEAAYRLIELGADVNGQTKKQHTALLIAAGNGHGAIVKLLLGHGADPSIRNYWGKTAAHEAADGRYHKIIKLLETTASAGINVPDNEGETPLILAAAVCDLETLEHLLSKRDKTESLEELAVALKWACTWDDDYDMSDEDCRKTAAAIIAHEPEVVRAGGKEALMATMSYGFVKTASLLSNSGVDIHKQDENGYTMLMHAVEYRDPDSVELLLSLDADTLAKNNEGKTALGMAEKESKIAPDFAYPAKVLSLLKQAKTRIPTGNRIGQQCINHATSDKIS